MPRTREEFAHCLTDARTLTLALVEDLSNEQLTVPLTRILNPLLWEIGHVAWFQERWILRHLGGHGACIRNADELFDSAAVLHDTRWQLALPDRAGCLEYLRSVLERVLEAIETMPLEAEELELLRLVLFHEDMHCEALVYMRQTMGYPAPVTDVSGAPADGSPCEGDVAFEGGTFEMGAPKDQEHVFDNERWAHAVQVAPFRLARAPVTEVAFSAFVDDGGYARDALWTDAGRAWRNAQAAAHPVYWRKDDGRWMRREFDRWVPLRTDLPVIHVNAFEAEAFARWADRRLPTEAEWEFAAGRARHPWGEAPADDTRTNVGLARHGCVPVTACSAGESSDGVRHLEGNTWEWTSTCFGPYPGFAAGHYKEYSAPWFAGHRVLRGGAYATRARLLRNTLRNFNTPDRRDVLAGFRTAADA